MVIQQENKLIVINCARMNLEDKHMDQHKEKSNTRKPNRLGFGAWQLGNPLWNGMSEEEGISLVQEAIQSGINFFDTAPGYGAGLSERILGKAIQGKRSEVLLNSKIGHLADGSSNFDEYSLESQIKASLERLQTTYLDSVLLHNPPRQILEGKTNHFQVLKSLKDKGLIRAYGVSIDTYEEMDIVLKKIDVDVIEILFNIFFQGPKFLFKKAHDKGISLIAKVPLDSGWLTGKYHEYSTFTGIRNRWSKEVIYRRGTLVSNVKKIVQDDDITKYAISFILSFPEITCVIPGIQNTSQLREHITNSNYALPINVKNQFIELYERDIEPNPLPW